MLREMGEVIYGSNWKGRQALNLDETLRICLAIFEGTEVEYTERLVASSATIRKRVRTRLLTISLDQ